MKLHSIGKAISLREAPTIGKIATEELPSVSSRKDTILFWKNDVPPDDSSNYLAIITPTLAKNWCLQSPLVHSLANLEYLSDGDVVSIDHSGFVRTLYRRNSNHNFIFVTDQCNSYCLMCSQPPKPIKDFDRIREHLRLIDLIDPAAGQLGLTGGEPTLFKDDFLRLIRHCKSKLPETALHVLTNGRLFFYRDFAQKLGEINHPDLMLGIPLYSDVDSEHDYVVQAKGAFEETVLGLHHLARYNVQIEIRVVLHKQTYRRLPNLAEFIAHNFPFVSHIALMGLEMIGFVGANLESLWIDPYDYQRELSYACELLFLAGLNVSIYNHQLCVLDRPIWRFARRSISDWKNIYLELCSQCSVQTNCGGFFQSGTKRLSSYIKPISKFESSATQNNITTNRS
jgi:His-Xaa-Ser system radical SAM maturase HxsC